MTEDARRGRRRHRGRHRRRHRRRLHWTLGITAWVAVGCFTPQGPGDAQLHRWWAGLGPVIPHDSFPADCGLCHRGAGWNDLVEDFRFDHEAETGVPLRGAHEKAACLRCHNDRGPVATFAARGCAGCHEDPHEGKIVQTCTVCHVEHSWRPQGQVELHNRTRFPLVGAHLEAACFQCHPGAFVGNFLPTDTECLTCHRRDLQEATNPPHIGLGWVDDCEQCHIPTRWSHAKINR